MKAKTVVLGMMVGTMAMSVAFASPSSRAVNTAGVKAELAKYTDTVVKSYMFGKGRTSAKGLAAQAPKIAQDKAFDKFSLRSDEKSAIATALSVDSAQGRSEAVVEGRLNNIASLVGARKVGQELGKKSDAASQTEGASLVKASDALIKTMSNSIFKGTKKTSDRLTADEMADAGKALDKMESISDAIVRMERAERDMYAAVELKRDELLQSGKLSGEEALIEAVMAVKKIDKNEAMKIVRKLRDCV